MFEPFVGEIRPFACGAVPPGWLPCLGQSVSVFEHEALFALIGTTYGGDGATTFQLPDLQGRTPVHQGPGFPLGKAGGLENVKLQTENLPAHNHVVTASSEGGLENPAGAAWGTSVLKSYKAGVPNLNMNAQSLALAGGDEAHENMQPFLVITYAISLQGVYPFPA